jgi:hypothetical protein
MSLTCTGTRGLTSASPCLSRGDRDCIRTGAMSSARGQEKEGWGGEGREGRGVGGRGEGGVELPLLVLGADAGVRDEAA